MENKYSHTKITTIWLIATFVLGLIGTYLFESGWERIGAAGLGIIFFGGIIGCFRTGRFFSWDGEVQPNQFEGILGWTGATLMVAAIVGLVCRAALGKF